MIFIEARVDEKHSLFQTFIDRECFTFTASKDHGKYPFKFPFINDDDDESRK